MLAIGCATSGNSIPFSLFVNDALYLQPPITTVITNSAGTEVGRYTGQSTLHTFSNLPADNYTITATDRCGSVATYKANNTSILPTGSVVINDQGVDYSTSCSDIEGRITLDIPLRGGIANLSASTLTIVAPSPSGVGTQGIGPGISRTWTFHNLLPNSTYYFQIDNGCGYTQTITSTTPGAPLSVNNITTSVQQFCSGTGNVTATVATNIGIDISYTIKNSAGTVVGNYLGQSASTYNNLPADTYTLSASQRSCYGPDIQFPNQSFVISPAGAGPVIGKKLGIICEDANGNSMTTGTALYTFNGAKPLKVDYRLTSGIDADYVNVTNNSNGTETIMNLTAYESYTVRVTDACGIAFVSQVSIGKLGKITTTNTVQPCVGQPYQLAVPDEINATYSWTKGGNVISTSPTYNIASYAADDDGAYTCTIVIAGCVTRVASVTTNSANCGAVLPVKLTSFTAQLKETGVLLSWQTASEFNSKSFEVERSNDATIWTTLGNVAAAGNSNVSLNYNYTDVIPFDGANYYRLKTLNMNGSFDYSGIVVILLKNQAGINILPNPVHDLMYITGNTAAVKSVTIMSADGKILKQHLNVRAGTGIEMNNYATGVYFIKIENADGSISTKPVIKK